MDFLEPSRWYNSSTRVLRSLRSAWKEDPMPILAARFPDKTNLAVLIVTLLSLAIGGGSETPIAQEPAPSETPSPPTPAAGASVDYVKDRESIFDAFYTTGLDTTKPYAVANLTIRKDNMVFLLKSGTVFLMKPIAGEVTGAAFIGDGEAGMTPPNRTERYMLMKYYEAEVLKEPFTEAVFRFSDGSDSSLVAAAKPD